MARKVRVPDWIMCDLKWAVETLARLEKSIDESSKDPLTKADMAHIAGILSRRLAVILEDTVPTQERT